MKKLKKSSLTLIILYAIVAILNITIWLSKGFSDILVKSVFRAGLNSYSRLTSLLPFSLGEIMIVIGILLIIFALLMLITPLLLNLINKRKKLSSLNNISAKISHIRIRYYKLLLWLVLAICYIMTFNCSSLYHSTTFSDRYIPKSERSKEQLVKLHENIVINANSLSKLVKRDSKGNLIADCNITSESIAAMKSLGNTYPELNGYYPNPKKLFFSDFASQQYLAGVYFPFSMEANYNARMTIINYPSTICHELCHIKGFIQEDEANFIAYLACINSDNDFLKYSGYLSVINYVINDCNSSIADNDPILSSLTPISELVYKDNEFLSSDSWKEVEDKAVFSTDTVDKVSNKLTDTSLNLNGVSDGMKSYSRVVELLLDYQQLKN